MAVPDEFSIPLSRTRLGAIILFGLVIISIGIWMAVGADPAIADRGLPELMQAFGVFGIVGFGLITVYSIRKLFDPRPGLTFTASGITDNSSAVATGFTPWSNIHGVTIKTSRGMRYLVVVVKDPDKYWARGNLLQRWLRKRATGYGSPVALSAGLLAIDFDRLTQMFEQYLTKYGTVVSRSSPTPPSANI